MMNESARSNSFVQLWHDEQGFVVSVELILIATILVIGLTAGLVAVRDAVVSELTDVARSVQELNQSYEIRAVRRGDMVTAGAEFEDRTDINSGENQCIVVFGAPSEF